MKIFADLYSLIEALIDFQILLPYNITVATDSPNQSTFFKKCLKKT